MNTFISRAMKGEKFTTSTIWKVGTGRKPWNYFHIRSIHISKHRNVWSV